MPGSVRDKLSASDVEAAIDAAFTKAGIATSADLSAKERDYIIARSRTNGTPEVIAAELGRSAHIIEDYLEQRRDMRESAGAAPVSKRR